MYLPPELIDKVYDLVGLVVACEMLLCLVTLILIITLCAVMESRESYDREETEDRDPEANKPLK